MTGDRFFFGGVFGGSLLLHLLVFVLVVVAPPPQDGDSVTIYRVNVVEAPSRPEAKSLTLSTEPISSLKLEAPTLNPEVPPLEAPEPAQPELERLPASVPDRLPQAPPAAPAPQAPTAPTPQGELDVRSQPPASLPDLPAGPARAPQAPAPPAGAPAVPPAPPAAAPELPRAVSPMEQLRPRVAKIQVQLEAAPADTPGGARPQRRSAGSLLSLRLFLNRVQEAVQESYKFPGGFERSLQVRIRLTIERDGSVSQTEIVTPSGDQRFDYAALLALRRAKFPSIPRDVEEERVTRVISFSP